MKAASEDILAAILVSNDKVVRSDVIILLEGDYYNRIPEAVRLFKGGYAKYVVVSGGVDKPEQGSFHGKYLKIIILKKGVPENKIILEDSSQNTREQAVAIMKLAKKKGWKKIILVASHYHQLRAFLTFLKAMREARLNLALYNAPVRDLSWFKNDPKESRFQLLKGELERINRYKNNLASFKDAIRYLKRREKKSS